MVAVWSCPHGHLFSVSSQRELVTFLSILEVIEGLVGVHIDSNAV